MRDSAEKLVMMANQIARAFAAQKGDPVEQTAAHIRAFWAPPMRARLIAHHAAGASELLPVAAAAVAQLAAERPASAAGER